MKTVIKIVKLVVSNIAIGSLLVGLTSAHAGNLEMTDEQNAKVSRFKAQERLSKNDLLADGFSEEDEDDFSAFDDDKCGVVDIGNVTGNKGFGAPQKIDVIITGDVINTGNNCN